MLHKYQKEATKTFKEHETLDPEQSRLLDWAVGLGGESGEVLELIKHHIFSHAELDKMELVKELGDVLWYLSAIAETSGVDMADAAELNLAKLNHRYNTGTYTDKGSQERRAREKQFTDTPLYQIIKARVERSEAPLNVIFIGPDGSGKTTIAKDVAKANDFEYYKCDYRQEDKPVLAKELITNKTNVVYDRFYWPDDPIYCSVKGIEMPDEYWKQYNDVIKVLEKHNVLYVFVNCEHDTLLERSKQWADDYVKEEDLDAISMMYNNWLRYTDKLHVSVIGVDTTGIEVNSEGYWLIVDAINQAIADGKKYYAGIKVERPETETAGEVEIIMDEDFVEGEENGTEQSI